MKVINTWLFEGSLRRSVINSLVPKQPAFSIKKFWASKQLKFDFCFGWLFVWKLKRSLISTWNCDYRHISNPFLKIGEPSTTSSCSVPPLQFLRLILFSRVFIFPMSSKAKILFGAWTSWVNCVEVSSELWEGLLACRQFSVRQGKITAWHSHQQEHRRKSEGSKETLQKRNKSSGKIACFKNKPQSCFSVSKLETSWSATTNS